MKSVLFILTLIAIITGSIGITTRNTQTVPNEATAEARTGGKIIKRKLVQTGNDTWVLMSEIRK